MKTLFSIILSSLLLFSLWGCSSGGENLPITSARMTVTVSIATSELSDQPAIIEPVNIILLAFSQPLKADTIDGNVLLYRVKNTEELERIPCDVQLVKNILALTRQDKKTLKEGEEYKLVITTGVRSVGGGALTKNYAGFFATNHSFSLENEPLAGLTQPRKAIVCISDLHLGDSRSIDNGYSWLIGNRPLLVSFLNKVRRSPNIRELVIVGDLFDEWVAPMAITPLNGMTSSEYVDSIAAANRDIVDALNRIIQDGMIKVTYIPGNHDMLATAEDIDRIFPGISQARDARGLGAYSPMNQSEIIIEHGHRYDFYNAPDPYSNRDITGTNSILPPGFFVTKIATTSDQEKNTIHILAEPPAKSPETESQNNYFLYLLAWDLILSQKPVQESPDAKIIKTGIDGYTALYAINDLVPYDTGGGVLDVKLYKNIQDNWPQRQDSNLVPVQIPTAEAIAAGALNIVLDAQALAQYITVPDTDKRIVVFGHTHKAILIQYSDYKAVYMNSGTWIDSGNPSRTFSVIIPAQEDSATGHMANFQYLSNGTIQKLDEAVLTYP